MIVLIISSRSIAAIGCKQGLLILLALPAHAMDSEEFTAFKTWLVDVDETDKNPYINVSYDCLAFSSAMVANATRSGYKDVFMANVQASQYPDGHWINAVLVGSDYIFIEPQADIELLIEDAGIVIVDTGQEIQKTLMVGKNEITITRDMLIPIKA